MAKETTAVGRHHTPLRPLRVTKMVSAEDGRKLNKTLLLQKLFKEGPQSRADLARASGLSRVLVSDLVGELIEEDVIEEIGVQHRTGAGKPAMLLAVRNDAFHIVAIDLSDEQRFVGVVTNLRGAVLHRAEAFVAGKAGDEALDLVANLVERLIELSTAPILGVGIGTPGVVASKKVVRLASTLGWKDVDMAARISRTFDGPVRVSNDANAAALGLYTYRGLSQSSLMFVSIEHGVGAGLIIGGSLVEGAQSSAGEIGHIVVDDDGDACPCGLRGCLDLAVSAPSLRARLRETDAGHDAILATAARTLGKSLAPMIAANGVNDIVIGGPVDLVTEEFLTIVRETITSRVFWSVSDGLTVESAPGGEDLVLLGAAALVLSTELGVA